MSSRSISLVIVVRALNYTNYFCEQFNLLVLKKVILQEQMVIIPFFYFNFFFIIIHVKTFFQMLLKNKKIVTEPIFVFVLVLFF